MTRRSTTFGALALTMLAATAWLGLSRHIAHAAPAVPVIGTADPNMAALGTPTAAVSDGQGSVVLAYPDGIVAVFKPATLDSGEPGVKSLVGVYRLHKNGLTERVSIALPPAPARH